ncbi:hypothetical protein LJC63_10300 [Ruminococcaceae bacterium OttesenSCG-928-L11]|nr:hypothetical protein [Ruminococcaceae bacterium OttesenSCG-928-L11]
MRKMAWLCIAALLLAAVGCGDSNRGIKEITLPALADAVIGPDGVQSWHRQKVDWHTGTDDFLAVVYGADSMRKDSETFDSMRNMELPKGYDNLRPPIAITFRDFDGTFTPIYIFSAINGLILTQYVCQIEKNEQSLNAIEAYVDLLDQNPNLLQESNASNQKDKWKIKWVHASEPNHFVQFDGAQRQDTYVLSISIGLNDAVDQMKADAKEEATV